MFGLLKKKNSYEQDAFDVYERLMAASRNPVFYNDMGVPDTFDGRFDCLVAHTFMVVEALNSVDLARAEQFNQALFDRIFVQMKITLREIGVGDVGIPLGDVLVRNLFGTVDAPDQKHVQAFAKYMKSNVDALCALDFDTIISKDNLFEVQA